MAPIDYQKFGGKVGAMQEVRIKLDLGIPPGLRHDARYRQPAEITSSKGLLWKGLTGDVATVRVDGPTPISIEYKLTKNCWKQTCEGIIDPKESLKYEVFARNNTVRKHLTLQAVSEFDPLA